MQRYELEAYLGDALADMTTEQVDRLHAEADRIDARYPDPDEQEERDAAMSAAVQYLLGETSIDDAARALITAQRARDAAMAAVQQIAVMAHADGMTQEVAAQRAGIARKTLLRALGKIA